MGKRPRTMAAWVIYSHQYDWGLVLGFGLATLAMKARTRAQSLALWMMGGSLRMPDLIASRMGFTCATHVMWKSLGSRTRTSLTTTNCIRHERIVLSAGRF